MQWTDEGIVLGIKRHGEANAILELMARGHGRHLGLVRGGAGSRLRPVLQPGNRISVTWRARLDEHLGLYTVEGLDARAASFLPVPHALYGVTHLAALCRSRELRGERRRGRSRLCVAEIGTRGVAPGRRAVEGQAAGAAGVPRRRIRARSIAARHLATRHLAPRHRRWLCADRFLPGASRARAARARPCRRARKLHRRGAARQAQRACHGMKQTSRVHAAPGPGA